MHELLALNCIAFKRINGIITEELYETLNSFYGRYTAVIIKFRHNDISNARLTALKLI